MEEGSRTRERLDAQDSAFRIKCEVGWHQAPDEIFIALDVFFASVVVTVASE